MYLRRSAIVKNFIAALVGVALYCEWFVYIIQPLYWPELKCKNDDTCTKILFIADPQIQGDLAVPPPLNTIFNWDSDRYLKSTFSVVVKHFKPDVLVYMGDLMDEGSISSMAQFHGYAKRLFNIFELDYPVTQVWIPGDNDIGGENEPIRKDKVNEFEKVFKQPPVIEFRNISFYKVNGITNSFPKARDTKDDNYKIVVSHYPITASYVFGHQVHKEIRPNIYFCAHEHESKYVRQDKELTHRETHRIIDSEVLSIPANDNFIYEIFIPTCSYRMGTSDIGYGVAILESNNHLRYTVFWSSTRFPYLFFYLALLLIVIIYCLLFCTYKLVSRCRQPKSFIRSEGKIPLLERI